jgi:L-alanine-DL-glutamate epimerase-like enolase superfamily enzyme
MRPALGPELDLDTVRLMREAVGPDFDLMVDAHTWWRMGDRSYDARTVEELAEAMGSYYIACLPAIEGKRLRPAGQWRARAQ